MIVCVMIMRVTMIVCVMIMRVTMLACVRGLVVHMFMAALQRGLLAMSAVAEPVPTDTVA